MFSPLLIVLSYVSSSMLHGFDWFGLLPLEGASEDCSSLRKKSVYLPKCQQYYATQLRHESCDQFSVLCACTPACMRVPTRLCVYICIICSLKKQAQCWLQSLPISGSSPLCLCPPSPGDPPHNRCSQAANLASLTPC